MQMIRFWFIALLFVSGAGSSLRAQAVEAPERSEATDSADPFVALEDPTPPQTIESDADARPTGTEKDQPATLVSESGAENVPTEIGNNAPQLEAGPEGEITTRGDRGAKMGATSVLVIPIREGIGRPILYVLRRGLKEAQAAGARAVVIDMDTPGGELGTTLEIMEALDKFDGETLVYVNKEAISAGAIISSVTDEIHFAPGGVIGAAAAVSGGGQEIADTMKQKINSYLNAKVRSFSSGKGYRAEVIRAMMDADYEFKIGDQVIKPKGELLSLTAEEAAALYGDPARPLLSSGTHETLEQMLATKYGPDGYEMKLLEVSWSEELASWLATISPLLMGLGLLCVFVEFKTPGFGIFGVLGGLLLAIVFFGHYTAGLSGHEAALLFVVGLLLVAVEIFLVPGTLVAGLTGAALMLGALVWSMIDVWPGEMPAFDGDTLFTPLLNVVLAVGVAVVGGLALGRFLPKGWFWDKMVLNTSLAGASGAPVDELDEHGMHESSAPEGGDGLLGAHGYTISVLRPMGAVEVAGRRHEAKAALGSLERGEAIRVVGRSGRTLIVEREVS